MEAGELFWPGLKVTQRVNGIMEAINYLTLNICLPIVTLSWNVYTLKCFNDRKSLFVLLSLSSSLLLSPSFAGFISAILQ